MKKEIYIGHGLYKQVEIEEKADREADEILTKHIFPNWSSLLKKRYKKLQKEKGLIKEHSFSGLPFSSYQTESERMQDELEPIIHPTQHDESDDLEAAKREEMTEFEKSEYKRKTEKRKLEEADYTDAYWKREFYNVDSAKEEVEWKIVELEGGGFIRRPFPLKKATLAGPDKLKQSNQDFLDHVEKHYFSKGEKWEHKYDT